MASKVLTTEADFQPCTAILMYITPPDPVEPAFASNQPLVEVPFSTARRGKIALLAQPVREEVNRRLERGEIADSILDWLNGLPETQELLQQRFDGQPISPQNLSRWRQGGYRVWLQHQEDRAEIQALRREAEENEADHENFEVADHLANQLVLVYVRMLREIAQLPDGPKKWQHTYAATRELNQLRRVNHEATSCQIRTARWEAECAATKSRLQDEAALHIERLELRGETALLVFGDRFNAIEKRLDAREAAGEPVDDDRSRLAIDRADLAIMAKQWQARPWGLPGHYSYQPAPPENCFENRFARYAWLEKPAKAPVAAKANAISPESPPTEITPKSR